MAPYAFRFRAYAKAHFNWDDRLLVRWPDAVAVLQSEYTGGADGRAYPVTIHGEIRGDADSPEEAEPRLANSLGRCLPILALAGNAAVADPLPVAFHGLDLSTPQPFVGYQTPRPQDFWPPGARRLHTDATHALMQAVGQHPQVDMLVQAIELYRRAVGHWVPEQHLLAAEFLWISAETLSRCLIETRASEKGITPKNLARLDGAKSEAALRRRYLEQEIFAGDTAALAGLEEASNGFEQGYMSVDDIRGLVTAVLEQAMGHVRRALIDASGVDDTNRDLLCGADYTEPRGDVPVIRFTRGVLRATDDDQPPPALDVGAIELDWTSGDPQVVSTDGAEVTFTVPTDINVRHIPDRVAIDLHGWAMRAANITATQPPEVVVTPASAGKTADGAAPTVPDGGAQLDTSDPPPAA